MEQENVNIVIDIKKENGIISVCSSEGYVTIIDNINKEIKASEILKLLNYNENKKYILSELNSDDIKDEVMECIYDILNDIINNVNNMHVENVDEKESNADDYEFLF